MSVGLVSRGDLLRALARVTARDDDVAALLGFHTSAVPASATARSHDVFVEDRLTATDIVQPMIMAAPPRAVPFWRAEHYEPRRPAAEPPPTATRAPSWQNRPGRPPVFEVLSPWRDLAPRLRPVLSASRPTRDVDANRVVEGLGRGRVVSRIPFTTTRRTGPTLQLVIDRSDRLIPFWDDQDFLIAYLRRKLVTSNVSVTTVLESSAAPSVPDPGGRVLVLGDLGGLEGAGGEAWETWARLGADVAASGGRAAVLFPGPLARCPLGPAAGWTLIPWERTGSNPPCDGEFLALRAERLLNLVSPAVRIEPGLLRAIRRLPDVDADAGTEADVWNHPALISRSPTAATLDPTEAKSRRAAFAKEPPDLQRAVLALIASWLHDRDLGDEVWFEVVVNLEETSRACLPHPEDMDAALRFLDFLRERPAELTGEEADVTDWLLRIERRATTVAWSREAFARTVATARIKATGQPPDAAIDPRIVPPNHQPVLIEVRQRGGEAYLSEVRSGDKGSLLGLAWSTNDLVRFSVEGDDASANHDAFWESGRPPPWADDWGRDYQGAWVNFSVPGQSGEPVTQRMRWIPPGRFEMGSPDDEEGRFDDEGPRHPVVFAAGFWMFDTACTEALWQAVTGGLPEPRRGARYPVTNVSWNEARVFIERLNALLPGLDLGLPSEAKWEYGCRAGMRTAYSFGDSIDPSQVRFESDTPVPVGALPPNAWGLFEMHGNLREWCVDCWHGDYTDAPTDGSAWMEARDRGSAFRVVRGGSWYDNARGVRAACRGRLDPSYRSDNLGFRCARVQRDGGAGQAGAIAAPAARAARGGAERDRAHGSPGDPATLRLGAGGSWTLPPGRAVVVATDREHLRLDSLAQRPSWASGMGRDLYGLHADFTVPKTEITQRMRWIPPGRFAMGSPSDESGRDDDEGPVHDVTFAEGFWLFDTPCTQALWTAVMGKKNPSRFKSPSRPVEQVSFDDAVAFIARLNGLIAGLQLSLPSEAEWEYACRAATPDATYAGLMIIEGQNNAPVLDDIAWYGGNSGADFDLPDGQDSAGWPEKQYQHSRAGTHPVGLKHRNAWGLYDMLGNVWEWCADTWHGAYDGAPGDGTAWIDPHDTDREGSADRVVRGGSWGGYARGVRAADRARYDPSGRDDDLGFRCARVQVSEEAERRARRSRRGERSEQVATIGPERTARAKPSPARRK